MQIYAYLQQETVTELPAPIPRPTRCLVWFGLLLFAGCLLKCHKLQTAKHFDLPRTASRAGLTVNGADCSNVLSKGQAARSHWQCQKYSETIDSCPVVQSSKLPLAAASCNLQLIVVIALCTGLAFFLLLLFFWLFAWQAGQKSLGDNAQLAQLRIYGQCFLYLCSKLWELRHSKGSDPAKNCCNSSEFYLPIISHYQLTIRVSIAYFWAHTQFLWQLQLFGSVQIFKRSWPS